MKTTTNNVVSLIVSADWHIGATDPYRFKKELMTMVKETIKEKQTLDLFIVSGDTFDMKEYLSSDSVKVFFLIMAELLELTKPLNTQFRFLEGTRTHDALQLSTLKIVFENLLKNKRVKFIEEVCEESLLGMNILYIPEEYVIDEEEYYQTYFNKAKNRRYDFLFGHGNTDLMWFAKKLKPTKGAHAPLFKASILSEYAYYSYFGHFHYKVEGGNNNNFKSIGPVSRWEFGKEDECGFYYVEYDKFTNVAIEEYIENIYAPKLPSIVFTIKRDYDLETLNKKIRSKLDSVKQSADKVRIIVNMDASLSSFIVMRDFILSSFSNLENVTLLLKTFGVDESESGEENIETTSIENSVVEKPYLYDKTMHDEARIAAFIRKKEGINISLESILDVIQKKDTKISI